MNENRLFEHSRAAWIGKSKGHCHCLEWEENCENVDELAEKYKDSPDVQVTGVLLRTERVLQKLIKRATLHVVGLGFYEFYINGEKIGDRVITPYITDFRKKIIFNEFDVTENIYLGKNSFCFELGAGWFCPDTRFWDWRYYWFGNPRAVMALKLECCDGTVEYITTDSHWKICDSAIVYNSIYDGEKVDGRAVPIGWLENDFDDTTWQNAVEVESPGGRLIPDIYPPLRAVKTLKPVGIKILSDLKTVYDFGENIPGFLRVIVHGKRGEKITLNHAERCHEDGTLDEKSNNRALCEDEYILRGDELEVYEPKFTWHGYQFACVTVSSPDVKLVSVESKLVCSDVETVGSFRCDNPIINDLHTKFVRTQRNCLIGLPIDCHQRDERLAWLGDAHVSAQTAIYNFRMDALYKNWLYDMRLAQNTNNGDMPYIVPRPSKESGTIDWSIAVCLIPLYCYEFYGDVSFFEDTYDTVVRYFNHLLSLSENYLLPPSKYGDWASPLAEHKRGDPACVATIYFYWLAKNLEYMAGVLEKESDRISYGDVKEKIRAACLKKFYNTENHYILPDTQCSNSMALLAGIIPDKDEQAVLNRILRNIQANGNRLTTGILGTKYLIDVLLNYGREDILYTLIMQEEYPSWRNVLAGRSTLAEHWNGGGSGCHCMFGSVDVMFYRMLAGITIDYSKNYELQFNPYVPEDIGYIKASLKTDCGTVSSSWQKDDTGVTFYLRVPDNMNAKFIVNAALRAQTIVHNGVVKESRDFDLSSGEHMVVVTY